MSNKRRSYSREFKQEAVNLVLEGGVRVAQAMLTSLDQRRRAAQLPGRARYLELTVKPEFRRLMTRALAFPSARFEPSLKHEGDRPGPG